MDRDWLEAELASGRSIEAIARTTSRAPSTVAYWVNKHGLTSTHAPRHAARGGIEEAELRALVDAGLSIRAIAAELGLSYTTVRHWLGRHGIVTPRARKLAATRPAREAGVDEAVVHCPVHGPTRHVRRQGTGLRCMACRSEAVSRRRREVKAILVRELGGACVLCGYADSFAALHFHHVDPAAKAFAIARGGVTRSLERAREEARKCVLLCARCHAEVESRAKRLPCLPHAADKTA